MLNTVRVGLNASPDDLPHALAMFPGARFSRVFGPPGGGVPLWASGTVTLLVKAGVTPWVSFKDWASDQTALASVAGWLDAMPATVPLAYLTYHHEPMGDMPQDLYRQRWIALWRVVRRHRNGPKVKLVPIFHIYPAIHKCSDRYSTASVDWVGDWVRWWPTMPDGTAAADMMGWDCYLDATSTAYLDPVVFFSIPVGAAYAAGVPLVIPEFGALRVPDDRDGTGRAAWMSAGVAHLNTVRALGAAWWNGTGTNGADYRLTLRPEVAAWRTALSTLSAV